jgi:hypothetical protein
MSFNPRSQMCCTPVSAFAVWDAIFSATGLASVCEEKVVSEATSFELMFDLGYFLIDEGRLKIVIRAGGDGIRSVLCLDDQFPRSWSLRAWEGDGCALKLGILPAVRTR